MDTLHRILAGQPLTPRELRIAGFLVALWFPLYAWRKAEDKKAGTTFYNRLAAAAAKDPAAGKP